MYYIIMNHPNSTTEKFLQKYIKDIEFMYLVDTPKDKIYKKDINMDAFSAFFNEIVTPEDKVILVGAEVLKHLFGANGISKLSGTYQTFTSKQLGTHTVGLLVDVSILMVYPHKIKEVEVAIKKLLSDSPKANNEKEYLIASSNEEADMIISKCNNADVLAIDLETSDLYPHKGEILGVCLSTKPHQGFYIPYQFVKKDKLQVIINNANNIVGHNIKYDLKWLLHNHITIPKEKIHDTMILAFLEDENKSHGLKELAIEMTDLGDYETELNLEKKAYCKKYKIKISDFSYAFLDPKTLGIYGCKDADATQQLFHKFKLTKSYTSILYKKLIYVSVALAKMELNGSRVDTDKLDELYNEFYEKIIQYKNELQEYAYNISNGELADFNPNSYQQVGKLIYGYCNLPIIELTSTGNPSTSSEILEKLHKETGNEIIQKLLEYRKLVKFHNTYLDTIKTYLDSDKCIRTNFNITGTTSGRLSSSGTINFQNIPSRDKIIKTLFIPRFNGWKIYQQDLVTAEVWVAALESGDMFLQNAFTSKMDFHGYTAKHIFNLKCEPNEVKAKFPNERQIAKTIVFAILYGATAPKIAAELGITKQEAQRYIDMFFDQAYQLKTYLEDKQAIVRETGQLVSRFGRIRRVPEVFATDKKIAEHAVKSAINFLFQSVASDINLFGFTNGMAEIEQLEEQFEERIFIPTKLVHDSIVGEVNMKYADKIFEIFSTNIQKIVPDAFMPIGVEAEIGDNEGKGEFFNKK